MKLSVAESNSEFRPLGVYGFKSLERVITTRTYSCGLFKDNHRTSKNFTEAHVIGLDFDDGLSIEGAKEAFKDYKYIIAPTKNHQKEKGGIVADRFRVILFLSEPITDGAVFKSTARHLLIKFPQADHACKDAARMFYQSGYVYDSKSKGQLVDPQAVPPADELSPLDTFLVDDVDAVGVDFSKKPHGFSNCKWAIANGAFEAGESNQAMMSLATTCRALNYTKDQTYYMCINAYQLRKARTGVDYNVEDLKREVINHVFGDDYRGAVYACKTDGTWLHSYCSALGDNACSHKKSKFNFAPISKLMSNEKKVDWLVDGFLTRGGFSLLVGLPKSGKSTIVRQLAQSICRGDSFLERSCKQGRILYLALEEQPEMLKEQFARLGVTNDDDILIHVGPVPPQEFEELEEQIANTNPALLIVDTLALFAGIQDLNNYNEVNNVLSKLREIARKSGTHIMGIHHSNKSDRIGPESILGSVGIHGAVDNAIIFNKHGASRYLTTSQRGGRGFNKRQLVFDEKTETYAVGGEVDEF